MADIELREIFSNNLTHYLEMNQYTQADMARHMRVSTATTAKWCTGQSMPRIDKIQSLCNWLGIEKNDLLEKRVSDKKPIPKAIRIPIYSSAAAGLPIQMNPEVETYEYIPEEWARGGEYFGVKINGDSMEPQIHDKDIVVARRQSTAETDDIVIVAFNGDDATCKKITVFEGGITLRCINSQYPSKTFYDKDIKEQGIRIIGKVSASLTRY